MGSLVLRMSLLCILVLSLVRCDNPLKSERIHFSNHSPEDLVRSLKSAYEAKDLEGYLQSLSTDFSFSSRTIGQWGKNEEKEIHQGMFMSPQGPESIRLELSPVGFQEAQPDSIMEGDYIYRLFLQFLGSSEEYAGGTVRFSFVKRGNGRWQIQKWIEPIPGYLDKTEGAAVRQEHYFPLQVGNMWVYEERVFGLAPEIRITVKDSSFIGNHLFYLVEGAPFSEYGYDFVRLDCNDRLLGFSSIDSSTAMLYDFRATVGDTWSYPSPSLDSDVAVELVEQGQTAVTRVSIFDSTLVFSSHLKGEGTMLIQNIAKGFGIVAMAAESERWVLKEARINGTLYADTTTWVGEEVKSWGGIKRVFLAK